jgi:hypothetical protein
MGGVCARNNDGDPRHSKKDMGDKTDRGCPRAPKSPRLRLERTRRMPKERIDSRGCPSPGRFGLRRATRQSQPRLPARKANAPLPDPRLSQGLLHSLRASAHRPRSRADSAPRPPRVLSANARHAGHAGGPIPAKVVGCIALFPRVISDLRRPGHTTNSASTSIRIAREIRRLVRWSHRLNPPRPPHTSDERDGRGHAPQFVMALFAGVVVVGRLAIASTTTTSFFMASLGHPLVVAVRFASKMMNSTGQYAGARGAAPGFCYRP